MSTQKYSVALVSFVLGCLLLIINSIGFIMGPVVDTNPQERKPVSNYDYRTLIWADANR